VHRLVDPAAGPLPDRASPEEGLLRHVIRPGQHVVVVLGHDPATDLEGVLVDDDSMPVHDVDLGMLLEIAGDVVQGTR
jgi:hypothetical protein